MALKPIVVFVFAIVTVVSGRNAEACSCARMDLLLMTRDDAARYIATHDAIFEGTVVSVTLGSRPFPPGVDSPSGFEERLHVVTVDDVNAVRGIAEMTVTTSWLGASCGYSFHVGTRYLIFSSRDWTGRLSVSLCGLTRPLDTATDILEYLKHLARP